VVEYLQGKRDLASAIEQTKLDVRHYAKRQMTWFRREAGVEWFEGFGEELHINQSVLNAVRIDSQSGNEGSGLGL
jgi:tRNA A37 N6-isopentenylltransferase MiaA